ncbi:hypothetical protein DM01DRAFT_1003130 [Hesseltinella vesiculosa]|uniref:Uncharacterized protein n=1 Tax=Hesseltinella vesiculosa TaxID=101127 RepID=A0A1X2GX64_9FUNG|nr:hypothetical protein DM01DRAFT_1003130 [Hesseltinella vesiculosa]
MSSIFGQVDPAAFFLAVAGVVLTLEQGVSPIANKALKNYNIRMLRLLQRSYDQTNLALPLMRINHDMSDMSVSILIDMLIMTFNISSMPLWLSIKMCIIAQRSTLSVVKLIFVQFANLFFWIHTIVCRNDKPIGLWVYDLEWHQLTVKAAIEELRSPVFGDGVLNVLYQISKSKSGPYACKLPLQKNRSAVVGKYDMDEVSLAELLITAFALYNIDGHLVTEKQDIQVLNQATVLFHCLDVVDDSFVSVTIYIGETIFQFSINAASQRRDIEDRAYLLQYACATKNEWLRRAATGDFQDAGDLDDQPEKRDLIDMAYAAGYAISTSKHGAGNRELVNDFLSNWVDNNFFHNAPLPWCQHAHGIKCHCHLSCFLIMDPISRCTLVRHGTRNVIVVTADEKEAIQKLGEQGYGAVQLASQSQIIVNSSQFKRTSKRILVVAGSRNAKCPLINAT